MPRAYFQCPKCGRPASTYYKYRKGRKGRKPRCSHACPENGDAMTSMTYCGDGWDGRGNWPHGDPFKGRFVDATAEVK
jgi:hypothetical protein